MQTLLHFIMLTCPALLLLCIAVWLADNTKLADNLLEYFEEE